MASKVLDWIKIELAVRRPPGNGFCMTRSGTLPTSAKASKCFVCGSPGEDSECGLPDIMYFDRDRYKDWVFGYLQAREMRRGD